MDQQILAHFSALFGATSISTPAHLIFTKAWFYRTSSVPYLESTTGPGTIEKGRKRQNSWDRVACRVRPIWVQPIPIYSPSQYFCRYWYIFAPTYRPKIPIQIFSFWPIIAILADICRYVGETKLCKLGAIQNLANETSAEFVRCVTKHSSFVRKIPKVFLLCRISIYWNCHSPTTTLT